MSEKNFKPAQTQAYRFEFGSDGEIRTVSFKGRLPEEEADKVLEAAGRRAYKDAGAAIRSYLERQGLEYSGFESREAVLKHGEIMEWADALLHSGACRAIGARAGNADRYYAVMDHQEWIREGCCEGCCYAVKRSVLHSPLKAWSRHHVIGQTFLLDESEDKGRGFFAVRRKDGLLPFRCLCLSNGIPVLPAFGCLDMVGLLRNIESIHTVEQAKNTAIK